MSGPWETRTIRTILAGLDGPHAGEVRHDARLDLRSAELRDPFLEIGPGGSRNGAIVLDPEKDRSALQIQEGHELLLGELVVLDVVALELHT